MTEGYAPKSASGRVLGRSGVTIAADFDVEQHSEADLDWLFGKGMPIHGLLLPRVGLRRGKAATALQAKPLTVTEARATAIDRAVEAEKAALVTRAYDAAVTARRDRTLVPLRQLPREAQTVIASVPCQYGTLSTAAPTFRGHVVGQDQPAAYDELMDLGDAYGTRRRREAAHLRPLTL